MGIAPPICDTRAMSFWRKDPPPPAPPWRARFDEAKALVLSHTSDPSIHRRLDDVEQSLITSTSDEARLHVAIDALRPADAAAELRGLAGPDFFEV